jgi:transcriptional regulator with XRE-family HTH domain
MALMVKQGLSPRLKFGELLKTLRQRKGMTLSELAAASGVDDGNLSRIEGGTRKPPRLPRLLEILEALGLEEDSREFQQLLAAAARDRFETFRHGRYTYLGFENPLHGLPPEKQPPREFTLTQAAFEIGRISAARGVKKIIVEAEDGSKFSFPIGDQGPEPDRGSR